MSEKLSHELENESLGESPPQIKGGFSDTLKTVIKIVVAVALIYWLVHVGALDFNVLSKISSPGLIAFSILCVFLQIFSNNYRWLALLRGQQFETTIARTMPLSLIGTFFNFAMPGGVGGDVVKGYYVLQEHPKQKFAAAVSIFMDRLVGFFVMIATAFVALFFNWGMVSENPQLRSIAFAVTLLLVGFLVFFFLSFSMILQKTRLAYFLFEKLPGGAKLKKLYETLHSYRHSPKALAISVLMSVFNQLFMVAFVYAIGIAMGVEQIPLSVYFFLVPVGTVVQALPISPAGIGVGQAAFYFLFNLYLGKESQLGPTAVTSSQLVSFFWGLFGAYFYLRRKKPVQHAS